MRRFLFLQGPHGPFFRQLSKMLRKTGADTIRVGFNKGDEIFWGPDNFIAFTQDLTQWPDTFSNIVTKHTITDVVLYGDTRPIHKQAIEIAQARNITIHVFEEGYMRPYWITYERNGSNGNSRLMDMSLADMQQALQYSNLDTPMPPSHWGDTRQHIFYGAVYHWLVMFANRKYRHFKSHRRISVQAEFALYVKRLLMMPFHHVQRRLKTHQIIHGEFPYHLVLLQLEHDASFQMHSPFDTMAEFLERTVTAFTQNAPHHHHLVFKAHPLEDGRAKIRKHLTRLAAQHGLGDRVHYVRGGKLAQMLDQTLSAITVNSTAGQQVLWRGIPLKIFGRAVYGKPEFVSRQTIENFFRHPDRPDATAYRDYRRFLLETSQVPGGYYSAKGRRQLMRLVVDMMLSDIDPYDALHNGTAAPRAHLAMIHKT